MSDEQTRSLPGTEDRLPGQWAYWRALHGAAARLFRVYGYGELATPVIEDTRLFVKGTGETTDIVEKQMYTIEAGDGESRIGEGLCGDGAWRLHCSTPGGWAWSRTIARRR